MTDQEPGLQERLRRRLRAKLGACSTCGFGISYRENAKKTGVPVASLHRFMSGKVADGTTLDKIDAFLGPEVPND